MSSAPAAEPEASKSPQSFLGSEEDFAKRHEAAMRFVEALKSATQAGETAGWPNAMQGSKPEVVEESWAAPKPAERSGDCVFQPAAPAPPPRPERRLPETTGAKAAEVRRDESGVRAPLARPTSAADHRELARATRKAIEDAQFWDLPVEEALREVKLRAARGNKERAKSMAAALAERTEARRRRRREENAERKALRLGEGDRRPCAETPAVVPRGPSVILYQAAPGDHKPNPWASLSGPAAPPAPAQPAADPWANVPVPGGPPPPRAAPTTQQATLLIQQPFADIEDLQSFSSLFVKMAAEAVGIDAGRIRIRSIHPAAGTESIKAPVLPQEPPKPIGPPSVLPRASTTGFTPSERPPTESIRRASTVPVAGVGPSGIG